MTLFYYHVFSPFSHFPSCVLLFPLLFSPFFLQLAPILLPPHLYFCIPLSPFSCLLLLSCPALCVSIHVFFPLVFSSCDFSSSTFFPLISFSLSSNFLCCPHLLPFPFTLNSFPFFHLLSVMPFHLLFIISLYSPSCLPVSFPPPSPPIIYNPLLPSFVISFNLFFFSPFATSPSSILLSSTCHLHTFLSPFPVFFPASFLLSPHPLHSCFLSTPFLFVLLGFLLSSPRLSSHLVPAFPPLWNAALFCFDLFIRWCMETHSPVVSQLSESHLSSGRTNRLCSKYYETFNSARYRRNWVGLWWFADIQDGADIAIGEFIFSVKI